MSQSTGAKILCQPQNDISSVFSAQFKRFRKAKGLTQQELADILGVHKNSLRQWEKGLVLPEMGRLDGIADALEVNRSELTDIRKASNTPATINEALQKVRAARKQLEAAEHQLEALLSQEFDKEARGREPRAEDILGGPL